MSVNAFINDKLCRKAACKYCVKQIIYQKQTLNLHLKWQFNHYFLHHLQAFLSAGNVPGMNSYVTFGVYIKLN